MQTSQPRWLVAALVGAALTACGAEDQQISRPDRRSWAERMQDAESHDRAAASHEAAAHRAEAVRGGDRYTCGDPVLNDHLTTGGIRVTSWQPCFDIAEEAAMSHLQAAQHERELALRDRRTAAALANAETLACGTIPERERDHSAFAHRKEIAEVLPHRESGQVRGVWVIFKPVPGLDADWVRRDIECQRARWAVVGEKPELAAGDPTLVPGASVQVFDRGDHVDVLVVTDTVDAGQLAVARAEGIVPHESTANR